MKWPFGFGAKRTEKPPRDTIRLLFARRYECTEGELHAKIAEVRKLMADPQFSRHSNANDPSGIVALGPTNFLLTVDFSGPDLDAQEFADLVCSAFDAKGLPLDIELSERLKDMH